MLYFARYDNVDIITWAVRKGKGGAWRMEDEMIQAPMGCPYILRPFGFLQPKGSLVSRGSRLYPNLPASGALLFDKGDYRGIEPHLYFIDWLRRFE